MTALASVDLPEPLGPMSACTSPGRTMRSRPLRICLSSAWTWRFSILSSAILSLTSDGLRGGDRDGPVLARREGDELGQGRAGERLHDAAVDARPQQLRGAAVAAVGRMRAEDPPVAAVVHEALHRGDDALEGEDHLVHRERRGVACKPVAAVRPTGAVDEAGLAQQRDDPLEVG